MKIFEKIALFSFFIILTLLCHKNYLFDYPSYTHAWSQSDRYALANGFVDNNLNLFQPQTSVYNHPIPNNWKTADPTRFTSVDFPIHDFVPAVFMKLFGNRSPFFFRFYILLYGFIGLYFLYKLAKSFNNSVLISFIIVVFASTTPVFVYYHSGFLPTIPSLSNAIIGLYFYFQYSQSKKLSLFYWALFFLCFSALARTTFIIPLFAVFSYEFLLLFKEKIDLKKKIFAVFLTILILTFYYFYNNHLRNSYGSLFLNKLLPAKNWIDFKIIVGDVYENWLFHYFSMYHYFTFFILVVIALATIIIKKVHIALNVKKAFVYLIILFVGNFIFFLLMVQQYSNHDYYFIDTFYLPIILLLILITSVISVKKLSTNILYCSLLSICSYLFILNAIEMQNKKRETGNWDTISNSIDNFKNSENFVLKHGITIDEKVIVLNGFTPNIPFVLMNRVGYCTMFPTKKVYSNALDFPAKFVIFQNDYFLSDIYSVYPSIINRLNFVASNGKITICTKRETASKQSLDQFLQLDTKRPIIQRKFDFEKHNLECVFKTQKSLENSKNSIGLLTESEEFGLLLQSVNDSLYFNHSRIIKMDGLFQKVFNKELKLVVTLSENDSLTYYYDYDLKSDKNKSNWNKFTFVFNIPASKSLKNELKIYFWNPQKGNFHLDDLEIKVY